MDKQEEITRALRKIRAKQILNMPLTVQEMAIVEYLKRKKAQKTQEQRREL